MTSVRLDAVAIIGCGLIGGSVAKACAAADVRVFVTDTDERNLQHVCRESAAVPWQGEPVDIVVVAVPPESVIAAVTTSQTLAPQTPVTDVASVKAAIVGSIDSPWFIGGHPLAGAATSGPVAASAEIFARRPWVTCARQRANAASRAAVSALIGVCGAHEVRLSPDEHDRAAAVTSHAVQITAAALAVQWSQLPDISRDVRGRAFDEVLRLASSNPQLWEQIASANAGALAQALLQMADQLTDVADSLAAGDATGVSALLAAANEAVAGE